MKPTFIADRAIELPEKDQGLNHSIVRLYSHRIDRHKRDPKRFKRRQAVLIKNSDTGNSTIRFVMGSGPISVKKTDISIDYDACDSLGIRFRQPVNLIVRPATLIEVLSHYFGHPEMGIRVSMRLAAIGVGLGIVGTLLGIVSIVGAML